MQQPPEPEVAEAVAGSWGGDGEETEETQAGCRIVRSTRYAKAGTDQRYAVLRRYLVQVNELAAICLQPCYAATGANVAYASGEPRASRSEEEIA